MTVTTIPRLGRCAMRWTRRWRCELARARLKLDDQSPMGLKANLNFQCSFYSQGQLLATECGCSYSSHVTVFLRGRLGLPMTASSYTLVLHHLQGKTLQQLSSFLA